MFFRKWALELRDFEMLKVLWWTSNFQTASTNVKRQKNKCIDSNKIKYFHNPRVLYREKQKRKRSVLKSFRNERQSKNILSI